MILRAVLLLPLLLASCTSGAPADVPQVVPARADALAQVGRWTLQSATDAHGQSIAAVRPHGRAVHSLLFQDGGLALDGGCNHLGARYRIDRAGRLVVPEIESTVMACEDQALMQADEAVTSLLRGQSEWTIAESYPEQLFLKHGDGRRSHWVAARSVP